MIIHSIVPHEMIFPANDSTFSEQKHLIRNGIPMLVEPNGNQYKVIRIMSSNPADYLRDDLCPGSYISLEE